MTLLERHLEDPVRFRRLKRGFYAGLVALAGLESAGPLGLYAEPGHFWFEDLPGWGSLYGLVACIAIVVVSKLLGKVWLTRPDTYYDS